MAEEKKHYTNGGLVFKNMKRDGFPNDPEYSGNNFKITCPCCNAESEFKIALHVKEGQRGKYFAASIWQPKYQSEPVAQIPEQDSLPF